MNGFRLTHIYFLIQIHKKRLEIYLYLAAKQPCFDLKWCSHRDCQERCDCQRTRNPFFIRRITTAVFDTKQMRTNGCKENPFSTTAILQRLSINGNVSSMGIFLECNLIQQMGISVKYRSLGYLWFWKW